MRSRYLWAAAVAVVVASAVTVVSVTANAEDGRGSVDWKPCPDDEKVKCASITVPLDWSNPDGEEIDIALAMQPATEPESRIGSILMNPGGPGGSGVDKVASGLPIVGEEVAKRFDVVGFDPRGVNKSTPIKCDAALAEEANKMAMPTNQDEFDKVADVNRRLAEDCRERTGPLFDHVDNLSVVEDMDAIRSALGEEKLNFLGYSYGTLMGQQYAEKYGDRIRTMVLDSNMDHSLATPGEYMETGTAAFEENFVAFADWCDTTKDCALNGDGTRDVYAKLRESAKAGELTDPKTGDPIDFEALSLIAFAANNPEMWDKLDDQLKALRDHKPSATEKLAEPEEVNEPFQPIWCQDWDYQVKDFEDWRSLNADVAERHPNVESSPYNRNLLSCVGYPGETTNPQRPLEIDDAPSMLMVGSRHDPSTPYPWSTTAARQSGASLVTYEGYGHGLYGFAGDSDCVNKAVESYLIDQTTPADDLTCPADGKSRTTTGLTDGSPGPF
ncbi:alpha/beta hydrolase [Stackebrandtia nassauensis]|uniref:TAP domain protein n=1 Tax=Stackebrandtia nassauensis (strain DSM 44728 / CIP 108903 / NRRL B-16338 / NBRC 102104 / LLR-40K-21) TaxID=446470 RepID=D3Q4L9_STANL|nr:alpha/beta hydrolase [Stackebrandtia nassauensis]ADD40179.1 TAP domain protein [Stackebrandtia nassauensis DSM 44728]